MLLVLYPHRQWAIETILDGHMTMGHQLVLVMLGDIVVQDMMILHHVSVVVHMEIFVLRNVATIRVPVPCMATTDRMIVGVMLLITVIHMNYHHRSLEIEKGTARREIITMHLRIEISMVIGSNLHHNNDVILDLVHTNMVVAVRDVVVSMALVTSAHHMTIISEETGMVQGGITVVHRRIHHPVRRHVVKAPFMVVINFIVVMVVVVVEEEVDDDQIVLIHVTLEIATVENRINKQVWNEITI